MGPPVVLDPASTSEPFLRGNLNRHWAAAAAGIATVIAVTGYIASGLPDLGTVPAGVYATFIVVAATAGGAAMAVFVVTGPEKPAP